MTVNKIVGDIETEIVFQFIIIISIYFVFFRLIRLVFCILPNALVLNRRSTALTFLNWIIYEFTVYFDLKFGPLSGKNKVFCLLIK
jgi:hypothetical protein